MRILMITHVGETVGHVVRALAIADELANLGESVEIAAASSARWLLSSWGNRYKHHEIRWEFSHNSCDPVYPTQDYLRLIGQSNQDILELLDLLEPDLVIGFPGIFSFQACRHLGFRHISILHGPYLSPIVSYGNETTIEKAVLDFAKNIFYGGCVDRIYSYLNESLGLPKITYRDYLQTETIIVPQPNLPLPNYPNIRAVSYIRASFGPPVDEKAIEPEDACYITFGSGNQCDIRKIVELTRTVYPRVIVTTGNMELSDLPDGIIARRFIASSSLAGRVAAVISHGGIGTVGTFAEANTPQMIIPTELDQATMAVHAKRQGIAHNYGLEEWALTTQLGRRLVQLEENLLLEAIHRLRTKASERRNLVSSGALEIANIISHDGVKRPSESPGHLHTQRTFSATK